MGLMITSVSHAETSTTSTTELKTFRTINVNVLSAKDAIKYKASITVNVRDANVNDDDAIMHVPSQKINLNQVSVEAAIDIRKSLINALSILTSVQDKSTVSNQLNYFQDDLDKLDLDFLGRDPNFMKKFELSVKPQTSGI